MSTKQIVVQMETLRGTWFDIDRGQCKTLSEARRKRTQRLNQNDRTMPLRHLRVRIIERVETEVE
jgi:hypothetical protein